MNEFMSPIRRQYYSSSTNWKSRKKKIDTVNIKTLKKYISGNNSELIWRDSVLLSTKNILAILTRAVENIEWTDNCTVSGCHSNQTRSLRAQTILSACLRLTYLLWQSFSVKAWLSEELNCQIGIHFSVWQQNGYFFPPSEPYIY